MKTSQTLPKCCAPGEQYIVERRDYMGTSSGFDDLTWENPPPRSSFSVGTGSRKTCQAVSNAFHGQSKRDFQANVVISEDEEALILASGAGFYALREEHYRGPQLCAAASNGNNLASRAGSFWLFPTDLPMLTMKDLRLLAEYVPEENGILLVQDHHAAETNALLTSPG